MSLLIIYKLPKKLAITFDAVLFYQLKRGLYLSTKGSKRKVSEYALVHSNEGTFMNVKSPHPKKIPFRMSSGGHGEDNIKLINKY